MPLDSAEVLVNRYRLERRLASGAVSQVWQATDLELARRVAIKVLDAAFGRDAEALQQFRAVSCRASSLVHEGIVRIFDYVEPPPADGAPGPFLVMELVNGPSVAELMSAGPLDAVRSLDIVAQVASALEVIHQAGLTHGDVKPQNLLVTDDGVVKLVDLVPADQRDPAGTTTDGPAADLYALGITAGQCLSGSVKSKVVSGTQAEVPRGVPVPVTEFIRELTATDPARRPASALQVAVRARQLRGQFAATASSTARPAVPQPRPTPGGKKLIHHIARPTHLMPAQVGPVDVKTANGTAATDAPVRVAARLPFSTRVSAVILLAVAALTGYAFLKPSSLPRADPISHVTMVTVKASDLSGIPVPTARQRLVRLGLVVHVRWRPTSRIDPGRVISVSPSGRVPVGSVITLIGSSPASQAGSLTSHAGHPVHKHHARRSVAGAPSPTPAPGTPSPSPTPTGSPPPSPSPPPSSSPPPPTP